MNFLFAKPILRRLSWSYLALLALVIGVDVVIGFTTPFGVREGGGCNFYWNALAPNLECRQFPGAKAIDLLLNWPLFLLYMPVFGLFSSLHLVFAVLLWAPPIYLVADHVMSLQHGKKAAPADPRLTPS